MRQTRIDFVRMSTVMRKMYVWFEAKLHGSHFANNILDSSLE